MDAEVTDLAGIKALTVSSKQDVLAEGAFVDGDKTKLDGIEAGATADQTKADINGLAITEVGTISSGTWNGTAIAITHGGTGATTASAARNSLGIYSGVHPITSTGASVVLALADLSSAPENLNDTSSLMFIFRGATSLWIKSAYPTDTDGDNIYESITLVFNNNTTGSEKISYIIIP